MNDRSRARLLLVELILDLVIFALCAAVCVALLVRARSMSRESAELTQAVYLAQSAAETFRAGGEIKEKTTKEGYEVTASMPAPSKGLKEAQIDVFREGRLIYSVSVVVPQGEVDS